jgi:mannan endo-1,4-beta-mannosidase
VERSVLMMRRIQALAAGGLLACALATVCGAEDAGPVFVCTDGAHFVYRDAPFYYAGTNCYYLSYFSADPARRQSIDDLLDLCKSRGFNVIRTWAFNDGGANIDGYPTEWAYQQTPTSEYNEVALQGLDYALDQARQRNLKLILTFTNNWTDYGGMPWYVDASPSASAHDDFYTDGQCKEWFKARIQYLVNRRNSYNDMLYRDDPTIFAWELANEPRCWDDWRSLGLVFRTWASEMSAYIKSLAPDHMVTTGVEGFYNQDHIGEWPAGHEWLYDGGTGTDFIDDHKLATIDFCTVHIYPDHWNVTVAQAARFLQHHLDDATNVIGKPVILEEFGKREPARDAALEGWSDDVYASAAGGGAAAGWNIWMIEAEGSGHDDTFSLFTSDPGDLVTIDLLTAQAARMNSLTAPDADVNVDGVVNILDLIKVRNNLTKEPGSTGYIRADVNRDGNINIFDLIAVRNDLNTRWP